jgi:hypothetical protein
MKCVLKVNSSVLGIELDLEATDFGYSIEVIATLDGKPVFNPALHVTDDYSIARMNLYADAVKPTLDGLEAVMTGFGTSRIDLIDPDGSITFNRYFEKPSTVYVDIEFDICCFSDSHCFSSEAIGLKTDMTFEDYKDFVKHFTSMLDKFHAPADYKHQ